MSTESGLGELPLDELEDVGRDPDGAVEVGVLPRGEAGKVDVFLDLIADLAEEGGKVGIYRTWKGRKDYLGEVSAEILSLGWVQENMGGGKYQFNARDGANKYAGAVTLDIAGKPKPWPDEADLAEAEEAEEVRELRKMMEELKGGGASMDMFKMVISMVTLMNSQSKPYIEALLAKGNERTTASELKDLLDLVRDMGGGAAEADPFAQMVRPLIPPLVQILSGGAPHVATNPLHEPGPAPTFSTPPVGPGSEWVNLIRPHVNQLQGWAAAGKHTVVIAQFVANTLEQAPLGMILEQLGRGEQFLIEFFLFFPETKTFEPWYRGFWSDLAAQFEWDDEPETEDTGAAPPDLGGEEEEGPEEEENED